MSVARIERWILSALLLTLAVMLAGSLSVGRPAGPGLTPLAELAVDHLVANVPTWPPSNGLVVAEVVTRGAGASDQYVELYNASGVPASLAGLELAYVTASGATVTKKQSWADLVLPARHHLLIANSAGAYAAIADGLFSGGFATTGGSLVLRTSAGGVIDALSWGTAASTFVEGQPGAAPPTGSSLERLPGAALGNALDTNDNLADTHVQAQPLARGMAAGPLPEPTPMPSPSASSTPDPPLTPSPSPEPPNEDEPPGEDNEETPELTPSPDLEPVPEETATPDPTASPSPEPADPTAAPASPPAEPTPSSTPQPTGLPTPTPTSPPQPTAQPSPGATASPQPPPPAIGELRALPLGTTVVVHGRLTTPLGLTESGRGAFVEDESGGLALYLASGSWPAAAAGTAIVATGVLETRFSLLTLRVAGPEAVSLGDHGALDEPLPVTVAEIGEQTESRLVVVEGTISESASTLSDGFSTAIDDGSGTVRVIVAAATGIDAARLARGTHLRLAGVVGQRDTSGTGLAGYRIHLRSPADVIELPAPTPSAAPTTAPGASPAPSPTPTPNPAPSASAGPTPAATPQPTASAAPPPMSIAQARLALVGQLVHVQGVVTVRAGRILGDRTACIQDQSAGICVRLPDGLVVTAGNVLLVAGPVAAPYGNLELRPATGRATVVGSAALPAPRPLALAQLGEPTEGLLARVAGTVSSVTETSTGTVTVMLDDDSGSGRIFVHPPLGMSKAQFSKGQRLTVTGVVGDRLGLYRLWPRDPDDVRVEAQPQPSPTGGPGGSPSPAPGGGGGGGAADDPPLVNIAEALRRSGQKVTVSGVVSAPASLLDADGRRITMQDGSAAILLRLPIGAAAPRVGQRIRASGEVGTYYGAPQLAASDAPTALGTAALDVQRITRAPLAPSLEWRLVSVSGLVESVQRNGDAWRAEIAVDGGTIPVVGLARSGIPAQLLVKGRPATVTGLAKRAYPTAVDQRYSIVPRAAPDVRPGPGGEPAASARPGGGEPDGGAPVDGSPGAGDGRPTHAPAEPGSSTQQAAPAVALSELAAHVGRRVQVGGRITRIEGARLLVDDGSGTAMLELGAEARALLGRLRVGELVNAIGVVERDGAGGLRLRIDDAADVVLGSGGKGGATSSYVAGPSPTPIGTAMPTPVATSDATGGPSGGPRAAAELLPVIVGLLTVLGAVTGSATALLYRRPSRRAALQAAAEGVLARARARLEGWRARLATFGRP